MTFIQAFQNRFTSLLRSIKTLLFGTVCKSGSVKKLLMMTPAMKKRSSLSSLTRWAIAEEWDESGRKKSNPKVIKK